MRKKKNYFHYLHITYCMLLHNLPLLKLKHQSIIYLLFISFSLSVLYSVRSWHYYGCDIK